MQDFEQKNDMISDLVAMLGILWQVGWERREERVESRSPVGYYSNPDKKCLWLDQGFSSTDSEEWLDFGQVLKSQLDFLMIWIWSMR